MTNIDYKKLGIELNHDIPVNMLFDARYIPGLDTESQERIGIIRDIIEEYNKSLPLERENKIRCSRDAAKLLAPVFKGTNNEELWLLLLDNGHVPLKKLMVGKGGTSSVCIDHKLIARLSIINGASAVIIAHGHPSGNPAPSKADIASTEALKRTLDLVDISLVDSLIFSSDGDLYFSFSEETTKTI